jgi:hypothetical protein
MQQVELGANPEGRPVSQAELQQDVLRFAGQYCDSLVEAMTPLQQSSRPEVRTAASRQLLLYSASIYDIATEANPEVSLLDLIVFAALVRDRVDRHWIPKVFGEDGRKLSTVMARSEASLWGFSTKVLNQKWRDDLAGMIEDWRKANPEQIRVEVVRFSQFATTAGMISAQQAEKARGLLATLEVATRAADRAVLLAERAMFLANRMPFLFRLQVRVGARELIGDAANDLSSKEDLAARTGELKPMVSALEKLSHDTFLTVHEARLLAEEMGARPREPPTGAAQPSRPDPLEEVNALADKMLELLEELRGLGPGGKNDVAQRLDRMVEGWLRELMVGSAVLIVLFWSGYFVVKRASRWRSARSS